MRYEMSAFSIFHCCPLVFLTMNPADTKHSLTLIYSVDGKKIHKHSFPLGGSDTERAHALASGPNLAEVVATDPRAAVRAFHKIIALVFEFILGAPLSNNRDLKDRAKQIGVLFGHPDGIASTGAGGLFGDVRAYYGAIEAQLRRSLHIHLLL